MNFFIYLFKYYFFDFHYRYLRLVFRFATLLNHQFGIIPKFLSLFSPLFGLPGVGARIQGFVLRFVAIIIGILFYLGFWIFGLGVYVMIFVSLGYLLIYDLTLFLLVVALLTLHRFLIFYYKPITEIVKFDEYGEYYDSGDIFQRRLCRLIQYGDFDTAHRIIFKNKFIKEFFARSELPIADFENFLTKYDYSKIKGTNIIDKIIQINNVIKFRHIKDEIFLVAFILVIDPDETYLSKYNYDHETLLNNLRIISYYQRFNPGLWDDSYRLPPAGGVDKDWTVGASSMLNKIGMDYTKLALKGLMPKLIGRDDVKQRAIEVMRKKTRNNLMLIGDPGCGKTTFIKGLAREIATGVKIPELRYKRIVSLDIGALMSGSQGDIRAKLTAALEEINANRNVILFIDEIHVLSANSQDPGTSDIFAILEPHISDGRFQFIGATNRSNYNKYIEPNGSFARAFDLVEMRSADKFETFEIMVSVVKPMERKLNIKVSYLAYYRAYLLSQKYITNRTFPDKSVELIVQTIGDFGNTTTLQTIVTQADVSKFMAKTYNLPVDVLTQSESQKLLNIQSILQTRVVGQKMAIEAVSNALKRSRVGIRDDKKPMASFLFAGPTGVGKTETAKAVTDLYFGGSQFMIRIDMSEYLDPLSINRLIGDAKVPGILTSAVKQKPYSLILLDEIEKADRLILNLFLQVLDDARLTDGIGETVDFSNSIIIMTTNVGTKQIIDAINQNHTSDQVNQSGLDALKGHYPPEFLNRFNALVVFNPLGINEIKQIAKIKLNALAKRLEPQHIYLEYGDDSVEYISQVGYSPEWGARPINRAIEEKIETPLADAMIKEQIKSGQHVNINTLWKSLSEPKI